MSKDTTTWEIVEINLENAAKEIKTLKTFIADTVAMPADEIDAEQVLEVVELKDGNAPVLNDKVLDTKFALNYDAKTQCFEYLDSGGQGALVFGRIPEEIYTNQVHAWIMLQAYEKAKKDINKEQHTEKSLVDLIAQKKYDIRKIANAKSPCEILPSQRQKHRTPPKKRGNHAGIIAPKPCIHVCARQAKEWKRRRLVLFSS
jgi:hypothetical protein